jgi:hypothetical protein
LRLRARAMLSRYGRDSREDSADRNLLLRKAESLRLLQGV